MVMLATASVVLDTGARGGELCALLGLNGARLEGEASYTGNILLNKSQTH